MNPRDLSNSTSSALKVATILAQQVNPTFPGFERVSARQLHDHFTSQQTIEIIKLFRPLAAESFANPSARIFFAILLNMGADDVDVTPIVDEAERFQHSTNPIIREMIDNDQALLLAVIKPSNFTLFNRYLQLHGPALTGNQVELLRKAAKDGAFRTAAEFQWLSRSRFASIPGSAYAVSFIGQAGPILWDSDEETRTIEVLEARQHMLRRPNLGL